MLKAKDPFPPPNHTHLNVYYDFAPNFCLTYICDHKNKDRTKLGAELVLPKHKTNDEVASLLLLHSEWLHNYVVTSEFSIYIHVQMY